MELLNSTKHSFLFILSLLFSVALVPNLSAETAIKCHCFQDRSFNPADVFAADDYILATSFNSILSRSFGLPKKQIIMYKMKQGIDRNDLLVALKIAKATGTDLRHLFALRQGKSTWPEILSDPAREAYIQNDLVLKAIKSGIPVDEAGTRVADESIAEFYKVSPETIKAFRLSGLNEKEITLLLILAHCRDQSPAALVDLHIKEGRSWSEIAHSFGVEPAAAGKLILHYPAKQIPEE